MSKHLPGKWERVVLAIQYRPDSKLVEGYLNDVSTCMRLEIIRGHQATSRETEVTYILKDIHDLIVKV